MLIKLLVSLLALSWFDNTIAIIIEPMLFTIDDCAYNKFFHEIFSSLIILECTLYCNDMVILAKFTCGIACSTLLAHQGVKTNIVINQSITLNTSILINMGTLQLLDIHLIGIRIIQNDWAKSFSDSPVHEEVCTNILHDEAMELRNDSIEYIFCNLFKLLTISNRFDSFYHGYRSTWSHIKYLTTEWLQSLLVIEL